MIPLAFLPLAFLPPRIIAAIVDGTAPADLTVTGVAKTLPDSWAEQEERIGVLAGFEAEWLVFIIAQPLTMMWPRHV
jgi:hypothetical protein